MRVCPFSSGPSPISILRRKRSLMSITRFQVMPAGSMSRIAKRARSSGVSASGSVFVNAQLLEPAQHGRRKGALALLVLRAQPVEHRLRVDLGLVQHAGVDRRRDQVVRRGDGVDVAGQVQVEVLHRHHLAVAAAGRAALDAEGRPLRRLADRRHDALAQHAQPLRQADGGRGLALAQRRRRDGRHVDVLALRPVGELRQHVQVDLGLVLAVQVQVVGAESQRRRNVEDRLQLRSLRNLQIARDGVQTLHCFLPIY